MASIKTTNKNHTGELLMIVLNISAKPELGWTTIQGTRTEKFREFLASLKKSLRMVLPLTFDQQLGITITHVGEMHIG